MKKKVVIVGGGLSGLMLATRLARKFRRRDELSVVLIDRAPLHVWKPMLHTFAAGTANAHEDGVPFLAQARRAGFTFLPGEFYEIDPSAQKIGIRMSELEDGETATTSVQYDIAVIAIGGGANDFGTPGVAAHCHSIDSLWRAEALGSAIRKRIIQSSVKGGDINIAIVGGGATGVEFAAEASRLLEIGSAYSGIDLQQRLRLTLLESGERILGGFPAALAEQVRVKLTELGVVVRTGVRVASADEAGFALADGERIDAAVRVWAAGVKAAAPLSGSIGFKLSPSDQIHVTPTLQSKSYSNVFAMGDCAYFESPEADGPLPPTGQVARQQADHLFTAIPALARGATLQRFAYRDMGSLVSLSQYGAYGALASNGVLPSIAIDGWLAKFAHKIFYRMHQFGLYGPTSGSIIMLRDALNGLIKPPVRFD